MSEGKACCDVPAAPADGGAAVCPSCGARGKAVALLTVKTLLRPAALRRLVPDAAFRFCPTPACDVVYHSKTQRFSAEDLGVPVFQKSPGQEAPVCYCFGYTQGSVADGADRKAAILEIGRLVKEGLCSCETRNPQGSCCLGNVASVGR